MAASMQPQPLSITLLQTLNSTAKAFVDGSAAVARGPAGGPGPSTAAIAQLGFDSVVQGTVAVLLVVFRTPIEAGWVRPSLGCRDACERSLHLQCVKRVFCESCAMVMSAEEGCFSTGFFASRRRVKASGNPKHHGVVSQAAAYGLRSRSC